MKKARLVITLLSLVLSGQGFAAISRTCEKQAIEMSKALLQVQLSKKEIDQTKFLGTIINKELVNGTYVVSFDNQSIGSFDFTVVFSEQVVDGRLYCNLQSIELERGHP